MLDNELFTLALLKKNKGSKADLNSYLIDDLASGVEPSGNIVINSTNIISYAFHSCSNITGVSLPNAVTVGQQAFNGVNNISRLNVPKVETFGANAFPFLKVASINLPSAVTIGMGSLQNCTSSNEILIGRNIETIESNAFRNLGTATSVQSFTVRILGTPNSIASNIFNSAKQGDIYVPWAEGEVADAPWGASNATIHYNTVFDEEGNIISSSSPTLPLNSSLNDTLDTSLENESTPTEELESEE